MFGNIILVQALCVSLALANSHSACWTPAKHFSPEKQEAQGKETHRAVHAARTICHPGKNCNQGIIKYYPSLVTDIKAHRCVEILTYPDKSMSWVSGSKLEGNERFLIVGNKHGKDTRLCRSIVRKHTIIGENLKGKSVCTVRIRGVPEDHKEFEVLVINEHGKSIGIKPKVTQCKLKHPDPDVEACGGSPDKESSSAEDSADEDKPKHAKPDSNEKASASQEGLVMVNHGKKPKPATSSEKWNRDDPHGKPKQPNQHSKPHLVHKSSEDSSQSSEHDTAHDDNHQRQPCWSDLKRGPGHYGELNQIGFENKRKLYLVRLASDSSITIGTYCPYDNKIAAYGRKQSSETTSVQILTAMYGTLGWAPTTQPIYKWRIPRNAVIAGMFSGIPYALHQEPIYYTVCRPDLPSWTRNRKLLLGLANSQTGLCAAVFGGQVAYFTRFHLLITNQDSKGHLKPIRECSDVPPNGHLGMQSRMNAPIRGVRDYDL